MAHDHHHEDFLSSLTKNEGLVYAALKSAGQPLKAYDLLDILKSKGVRAPMTIYRALEGLETKGHVHKLDALNAYVLCNHDEPHQVQSFLAGNGDGLGQRHDAALLSLRVNDPDPGGIDLIVAPDTLCYCDSEILQVSNSSRTIRPSAGRKAGGNAIL